MSTKIHNGYILAPGTDVFAFVDRVRKVMNPIRDRLDARALAEIAVRLIDDADLAGTERPTAPLADAFLEFDDRQRKADKYSIFHDPNRFEMSLGSDQGRVLVLVYAERREFRDAFEAMDEVSEYAYWNNTDRIDQLTEEEWETRCDTWVRVLGESGVPAESMLTMRLRVDHFVGMLLIARYGSGDVHPLVLDEVPSRQWRAERLLRAARYKALDASGLAKPNNSWQMMRAVNQGLPETAADVALLLSDIAADDLTGAGMPVDTAQVAALIEQDTKAFQVSLSK